MDNVIRIFHSTDVMGVLGFFFNTRYGKRGSFLGFVYLEEGLSSFSEEFTAETLVGLYISPKASSPVSDAAHPQAMSLNFPFRRESCNPVPVLGKTFHLVLQQAFIFKLSPSSPQ